MKDGDKVLQELKDLARKRRDIGLFCCALIYRPPWYYWAEYEKLNHN